MARADGVERAQHVEQVRRRLDQVAGRREVQVGGDRAEAEQDFARPRGRWRSGAAATEGA